MLSVSPWEVLDKRHCSLLALCSWRTSKSNLRTSFHVGQAHPGSCHQQSLWQHGRNQVCMQFKAKIGMSILF